MKFKKGDTCAIMINGSIVETFRVPFDSCERLLSIYVVGNLGYEAKSFELAKF